MSRSRKVFLLPLVITLLAVAMSSASMQASADSATATTPTTASTAGTPPAPQATSACISQPVPTTADTPFTTDTQQRVQAAQRAVPAEFKSEMPPSNPAAPLSATTHLPATLNEPVVLSGLVAVQLQGTRAGAAQASNRAQKLFANGLSNTDVVVEQGDDTVRTSLVLNNAGAPRQFQFSFAPICADGKSTSPNTIHLEQGRDGNVQVISDNGLDEHAIGVAYKPWAVDAVGKRLATSYRISGNTLTQRVDVKNAVFPVVADPTYYAMTCDAGYYTSASADQFVDFGYCPVWAWFYAARGYTPVRAYAPHIYNDRKYVYVDQGGDCSHAPDTGLNFDFSVPCRAHDYCYDLLRAAMGGVVKSACDNLFLALMNDDCNDRTFPGTGAACRFIAKTYYDAVGLVGSPAKFNSPYLHLVASHSSKCADINNKNGGAVQSFAVLQQYGCSGGSNQTFRFFKYDNAGTYTIQSLINTGNCLARDWNKYSQEWIIWTEYCTALRSVANSIWRPRGINYHNQYSIFLSGQLVCWDVPYSSLFDEVWIITYPCSETSNEVWYMRR
ncbi:MAG: hypothetical protein JWS12_614 [Candidatus Saccharibacteria bacterium]|nr:hypothetical protein [Candidatus Saccharibacteria bacterium]